VAVVELATLPQLLQALAEQVVVVLDQILLTGQMEPLVLVVAAVADRIMLLQVLAIMDVLVDQAVVAV
jgi:hypothetical protein